MTGPTRRRIHSHMSALNFALFVIAGILFARDAFERCFLLYVGIRVRKKKKKKCGEATHS